MTEQRVSHELHAPAAAPLRPQRLVVLGFGVCAGTFVLALAVAGLPTRVGEPPAVRGASVAVGDMAVAVFGLALVVALALIAILRPVRRRPRDDEDQHVDERPPVPFYEKVIIAAVLLAVAAAPLVAIAVLPKGAGTKQPQPLPASSPGGTAVPAHAPAGGSTLHVHWIAFAAVAAAALAGLVLLAALRRLRRRSGGEEAGARSVARAVAAGIDELESERDPRRAVIKAYARMELALSEQGVARDRAETPLEYLQRALARLRTSRGSVVWLTGLFEEARFSRHEIEEPMREEALLALRRVRAELEQGT